MSEPWCAGLNYGWITSFTFDEANAYDTITCSHTNTDTDGSRARFMGVIVDGDQLLSGAGMVLVVR